MRKYTDIISLKLDTLASDIKRLKSLKEETDSFNQKIFLLRILADDKSLKSEFKSKLNLNIDEKLAYYKSKKNSDIQTIKINSMHKMLQKKLLELKGEFRRIFTENDLKNIKKKLALSVKNCIDFSKLIKKIFDKKQTVKKLTKKVNKENLYKLTVKKGKGKNFKMSKKLKKLKKGKKKKSKGKKKKH